MLTILHRELLVQSRRPITHRLRFVAVVVTLGIRVAVLLATSRTPWDAKAAPPLLFNLMAVAVFGWCLVAGAALTADCLSAEKRDGTLGLLFLTRLRGSSIVLGKAAAHSLQGAFALLAVLPVMALPILLGGVTAGEFWRMTLVMLITQFLSLSVGVLVSVLAQGASAAMGIAFLSMVGLTAGPLGLSWLGRSSWSWENSVIGAVSPLTAFVEVFDANYTGAGGRAEYWLSVTLDAGITFACLGMAAFLVTRRWRDGDDVVCVEVGASPARESVRRRREPGEEPYIWLTGRLAGNALVCKTIIGTLGTMASVCLAAGMTLSTTRRDELYIILSLIPAYGLHVVVKAWMAAAATQRFGDDARTGALELLLVTPMSSRDLLAQHRIAMGQRFRGVLATLSAFNIIQLVVILVQFSRFDFNFIGLPLVLFFVGGVIILWVDARAIYTVGPLMALKHRRASRAIIHTLARILLPGWLSMFFVFLFAIAGMGFGSLVFQIVLPVVVSGIFHARAEETLDARFKDLAGVR